MEGKTNSDWPKGQEIRAGNDRKTEKTMSCGPSRPRNTKEDGPPKAKNTIWGKRRKYMRRQMLEILAGHMMNHHVVLVFPSFASACIFYSCPRLYSLLLANILLYFWSGGGQQSMFLQLPCTSIAMELHIVSTPGLQPFAMPDKGVLQERLWTYPT